MTAEDIVTKLHAEFPAITRAEVQVKDYPTWSVPADAVKKICAALRARYAFDYLDMITAVDMSGPVNPAGYPSAPNPSPFAKPAAAAPVPAPGPTAKDTFEVIYLLTALSSGIKICLRCSTDRKKPSVASLYGVFMAADWQEREIYDLFGIIFEGHPNLQKILTQESLAGHPLRKDYAHVPDIYD